MILGFHPHKAFGTCNFPSESWLNNCVFRTKAILICLSVFSFNNILSQQHYSFTFKDQILSSIIQEIEDNTPYRFFYNDELLKNKNKLSISFQNEDIGQILNTLLQNKALSYKFLEDNLIVITPVEKKTSGIISGRITTANGQPMSGVNIILDDKGIGTTTDIEGKYNIYVGKPGQTLTFSHIGYITKEFVADPGTEINVTLQEDLAELEQVIVIGYAQMKRHDVTGAISSISKRDIAVSKSSNFMESLQGKAAGVDITRSSGGVESVLNITIRGNRSLGEGGASNEPLFVIDGVPYYGVFNLNPNDIESIEILKDASSTSIYGVAGANGVILVTTKKGKAGSYKVSFNAYRGHTSKLGNLPYANRAYYLKKKRDVVRQSENNFMLDDAEIDNVIGFSLSQPEREFISKGYDYNWYNQFIKGHGAIQDYNLGVSGGNEDIVFASSISYFDEATLIEKDQLSRYTIRLNTESNINRYFSAGASFMGSMSTIKGGSHFKDDLLRLTPLVPATDSSGAYVQNITDDKINPFLIQDATTSIANEASVFSTFHFQINLNNNLYIKSMVNTQYSSIENGYAEDLIKEAENSQAKSELVTNRQTGFLQNNILSYTKKWGIVHFNLIGGIEYQQYINKTNRIMAGNLLIDGNLWYNPSQSQNEIVVQLSGPDQLYYSKESLLSYISRFNFSLSKKYIFQFSGRYDGASQLSEGNKWSFFPSASFSWKINEEVFMANARFLSNLKLRFGYGVVGNKSIPPYSSRARINQNPLYIEFGKSEEKLALGFWPEELGNELLTWEKTKSFNMGIDYGFFDHRLNGNVELYSSKTFDLLQERLFPITSGFKGGYANVGDVSNKGLEMNINSVLINNNNLYSSISISFAANREQITNLGNGIEANIGKGWFVGSPVDVYYDYQFDGIWQENEKELASIYNKDPGDIKFKDLNNDSIINAEKDKTILGTPRPKWTGGASCYISYKNIDFTVSAFARVGQMILDQVYSYWSPNGREAGFALDYWTPNNPINHMPALKPGTYLGTYSDIERLQYTDGSYVKIKDIIFGYNVPDPFLQRYNISKMRFTCSLKNYFVFSKFFNKGRYDPELEGNITFPIPKMVSVGFNVEF
jgi:TonB-linked SusC/RagA family outer membrane protein